jgi:phosphatidylinositol alpha-mannosyltransferase
VKLALVCPYDYVYPGGVAIHVANLYEEFKRMGHDVRIITPYSGPSSLIGSRDIIPIGKPVPIPSGGSIARVTISPVLAPPVRIILEREQFDIIHIHEPLCSTLTLTILNLSKAINVGTFHACHRKPRGYQIISPFVMGLFKKLHGRIAVSEPAKEFVSKYFPGDYQVIPNGIDVARFSMPALPLEGISDGKLNILFVGRPEKRKGLRYLLEAYKQVKREVPQSRLIVVGPGTERYEATARKMELRDVIFTGYVENEQLPAYYHSADIFCSPATGGESFGIILLEAMAASKPVVASAISGYASVMKDGVEGIMVPPKAKDALAGALIQLLNNPGLRHEMGARGRKKAEECDWPNVAQRVNQYYMRLIEHNKPNPRTDSAITSGNIDSKSHTAV